MKVIRSWTNSTAREETQRLFGLVRDIRVEAQDLRSSLHEFQRASQQPDIGVRTRELEAAFKEGSRAFEDAAATIEDHFGQLRELQSDNPELYDEYGDKVTHAENLWLRALSAWQEGRDVLQTQQSQGQDIVAIPDDITRAAQSLDSLLHDTAFITIPERVNHLLRTKRDGQVLFFHDEFKYELPTEQWRKEMLH